MAIAAILVSGLFCFSEPWSCYAAMRYTPLKVEISFECLFDTRLPDGTYRINISPEDDVAPLPDETKVLVTEGTGSFHVEISEPGTYSYLVYQEKGDDPDMVYDDTRYEIHLFVTDKGIETDDSSIEMTSVITVNYAGTDDKPDRLAFANRLAGDSEAANNTTEESSTSATTETTTEVTTEESGTSVTTEESSASVTTEESGVSVTTEDATTPGADSKLRISTGDAANIRLLIILMTTSIIVTIFLIILKKRNARDRDNEEG